MSFEFLPGIPKASKDNTRKLRRDYKEAMPAALQQHPCGYSPEVYGELIDERKLTTHVLMGKGSTVTLTDEKVASWAELHNTTDTWLKHHLAYMRAFDRRHGRKSTKTIGKEGLSTVKAFLEVIPRVLARAGIELPYDDEKRNKAIGRYATCSQGFATEWARIGFELDQTVATSLALPSQLARASHNPFTDLHFDPELFRVDTHSKRVGVAPGLQLRAWSGNVLPASKWSQPEALYGCPALFMIPALYQAMDRVAFRSGLYGATYLEEYSRLESS